MTGEGKLAISKAICERGREKVEDTITGVLETVTGELTKSRVWQFVSGVSGVSGTAVVPGKSKFFADACCVRERNRKIQEKRGKVR